MARATRPFKARGISVHRCQRCRLAAPTCICRWRVEASLDIDFIIIMHHDEIFKPTNTGRLIADVFPQNTYVYEWSRTSPSAELLSLLQDDQRQCLLLFPSDPLELDSVAKPHARPRLKTTLVILDGTWKQARKMFRASAWLNRLKVLPLADSKPSLYGVRHAPKLGQLSTAEAVADALTQCSEIHAAQLLQDYFSVFKDHYLAARSNTHAPESEHHLRLEALKNPDKKSC